MTTADESHVARWANLPITAIGDLDYLYYLQLRRDSFIYELGKTEQGTEYLEDAWLLEQKTTDRDAARELFG